MTKPRLIFMRHGQTAYNQAGRIQGLLDVELSAFGQQAVVEKAHCLLNQGFDVDFIVSSSLL